MNPPAPETQNIQSPAFFAKDNISLGWSLAWRVMLAILPVHVIAQLIAANPGSARGIGAVAGLFALPIGNNYYLIPLALPLTLFLWNWFGKKIMLQRLQIQTDKFIGWSIYWRTALLNFAGLLVFSLIIALPMALLIKDGSGSGLAVIGAIGLLLLPALIVWNLNATGFVVRKVAQRLVAAGAAVQEARLVEAAPEVLETSSIRSYLALFDRPEHGINLYFGAGYFVASILSLFTWEIVGHLIEGYSLSFSPLKYYMVIFVFILAQTAALLLISYSARKNWLVPLLFGAALVLLGIGQRAVFHSMQFENIRFAGLFEARMLLLNFSWGFLFMAGLVTAVRVWGPMLWSMITGVSLALLGRDVVVQIIYALTREEYSFGIANVISTLLDSLLLGGLMYAGLLLYQRQKGLRREFAEMKKIKEIG